MYFYFLRHDWAPEQLANRDNMHIFISFPCTVSFPYTTIVAIVWKCKSIDHRRASHLMTNGLSYKRQNVFICPVFVSVTIRHHSFLFNNILVIPLKVINFSYILYFFVDIRESIFPVLNTVISYHRVQFYSVITGLFHILYQNAAVASVVDRVPSRYIFF